MDISLELEFHHKKYYACMTQELLQTAVLNPNAYGILRLSQLRGGGGGIFIPHPRKQC